VSEEVLSCPLPAPSAPEPPAGWDRLRQRRPVAAVRASSPTRCDDVERVLSDPRSTRVLDASGAGGHSCLGQALARTGLQVALEVLPSPAPAVEPGELRPVGRPAVGGVREPPVRW
jgi:cytochrome P450